MKTKKTLFLFLHSAQHYRLQPCSTEQDTADTAAENHRMS